jgi:hypothetical protein
MILGSMAGCYDGQQRYNYIRENEVTTLPRNRLHVLVALVGLT